MRVHAFLYAIDPWLTWPGFLAVVLALFFFAGFTISRHLIPPSHHSRRPGWGALHWLALALVLGAAGFECLLAGYYLFFPGYIDWVEPGAANIAWFMLHGRLAYPHSIGGELNAEVYGPLLYEITGFLFRFIGPTIALSKLPGIGAFAVAQILLYIVLRRCGATRTEALMISAATCVIRAGFTDQAIPFGIRADPWIFLFVTSFTLIAVFRPSLTNAAIFGALSGFAANLKLTAVLYATPLVIMWLSNDIRASLRARMMVVGVVCFVIALILPFGSLANAEHYVGILGVSARRNVNRWLLEQNIVMIVFLLLPIVWKYTAYKAQISRQLSIFFLASVLSMLVMLVPASKQGAGPEHYLPFLPSLAVVYFVGLRAVPEAVVGPARSRIQYNASTSLLIIVTMLGYAPILAQSWDNTLRDYAQAPMLKGAIEEIDSDINSHPGLRVAVGPGQYKYENLRVVPVFRGNPLPIDPVTWSDDSKIATVRNDIAGRIVRECRIDLWLLPRQSPYTNNPRAPLFYGPISHEFQEYYELAGTGRFFEQWRCRKDRSSEASPGVEVNHL